MSLQRDQERALSESSDAYIEKEFEKFANGGLMALGSWLLGMPKAGAGALAAFWGFFKHRIDEMRKMGLLEVRKEYGDERIQILGQQIAGVWPDEQCWKFVRNWGGTIWIQQVAVANSELNLVIFYHPSHTFSANRRKAIRIYKGTNQCEIEDMYPQLKSGR
jgi:hypothetical protein